MKKKQFLTLILFLLFGLLFLLFGLLLPGCSNKNQSKENINNTYIYNFENELIKATIDDTLINNTIYKDNILLFSAVNKSEYSYVSTKVITNKSSNEELLNELRKYRESLSEKYKIYSNIEENISNTCFLNYSIVDGNGNIITVYSKAESNNENTIITAFFSTYSKEIKTNEAFKTLYDSLTFKDK